MLNKNLKKLLCLALCGLQLSCTGNVFSGLASTNSDEALLIDAQTAVDKQQYQTAIDIILNKMTLQGQQKTEAKQLLAGGYAGLCGLNFLSFIDFLSNASGTSAFALTSAIFVEVNVDPGSCLTALHVMETIGSSASRTQSQNIFAAIAGMSLMGSATRLYTDNVPVGGNGSADSIGISCSLTDDQVDQVILGFGYMAENLSSLSTSQLGTTGSAFDSIISVCGTLGSISCNITKVSDITTAHRNAFRRILNTADYGVGTVVTNGDPVAIATACP